MELLCLRDALALDRTAFYATGGDRPNDAGAPPAVRLEVVDA